MLVLEVMVGNVCRITRMLLYWIVSEMIANE